MKYPGLILILFGSCFSAQDKNIPLPPDITVDAGDTCLHNANGTWIKMKVPYNGYIIEKQKGIIISKIPVINGKENGTAIGWYISGKRKYERSFINGQREGIHKGWYPNNSVSFIYMFHNDKFEGEQKTYYESGHPWQTLHYSNGYEEGKQKSWSDSGRVVNNFTVKNGKLYGVIGRYDCMSVYKK